MNDQPLTKSADLKKPKPRQMDPNLRSVLESGALLPSESRQAFGDFRKNVLAALGGEDDFVDLILIDEIVDHSWEAIRLRKLKSAYLLRYMQSIFYHELLRSGLSADSAAASLQRSSDGQYCHVEELQARFGLLGLSIAALEAQVLAENVSGLKEYDRMIVNSEERRDYHLKELERRRSVGRPAIRETIDLEDSNYSDLQENNSRT